MFKAFTGGESKASGKTPAQDASAPPTPVLRAATLMLVGAGLSVVFGVYGVIAALTSKTATIHTLESLDHESARQASSGFTGAVIYTAVICIVSAAIWVWMSRANRAGLGWARVASSVLFVLWTYGTWRSISSANTVVGLIDLVIMLLIWGVGGAAISQLWRPESSAFMRSAAGVAPKSR